MSSCTPQGTAVPLTPFDRLPCLYYSLRYGGCGVDFLDLSAKAVHHFPLHRPHMLTQVALDLLAPPPPLLPQDFSRTSYVLVTDRQELPPLLHRSVGEVPQEAGPSRQRQVLFTRDAHPLSLGRDPPPPSGVRWLSGILRAQRDDQPVPRLRGARLDVALRVSGLLNRGFARKHTWTAFCVSLRDV